MDLGWGSRTTGGLGSVSGLPPEVGWGHGATRGGVHMAGAGTTTLITAMSASITLTFITTGGQASCMPNIIMGSTRGTAGSGRIIGAPTLTPTRAVHSITAALRGSAATMATFTRMFREHRQAHGHSRHTTSMAAGMGVFIAPIRPEPGSETPAKPGNARQRRHARSFSNMPSAAAWANNASITSVRLAAGFRTPPAGLAMLAEEATGDLVQLN